MAQKRENLIRKHVLGRYTFDKEAGKSIANDFLQLSEIIEELQSVNGKAYDAMLYLVNERLELQEEVRERGSRIAKLQRNGPIKNNQ